MATEMNHGNPLSPMQNGTVATEITGTMATETILSYWHCITEMTGTTCSEMGGTVATDLSTKIAIEFALSRGIDQSVLAHLIDTSNRTILSEGTLLPYYPIFKVEEVIEYLRTSVSSIFPKTNSGRWQRSETTVLFY